MKGLTLAREFYEAYGEPMLKEDFPEVLPYLAAGLVGSGSECFGYDDEISFDHDFEPGFCIFLPGEDVVDEKTAFRLKRAYTHLPEEFEGFRRSRLNPVGGMRHGVLRMHDFYIMKCGSADGVLTNGQWLLTPEYALLEAVNGEVFYDGSGAFSTIRERLSYYPAEIRIKKLAGYLLNMAQSGQYNYPRLIKREDRAAAQLAVHAFTDAAMHVIFLLNERYMPYYKWSFRALRELPLFGNLAESLEFLISSDNGEKTARVKTEMIEDICALIIKRLKEEQLSDATCADMEKHAYSVNDHIRDGMLRNQHILSGVS
ncbi:MAG: DUF4037 domain-containing protein [Lachnospiraceae bacterium]|nr:DUF4037 domain-containing protein [Lachnospiraceae bacterium]